MPANNPAAYGDLRDVISAFNANPNSVGGFQAIADDLRTFAGAPLAERPEGFVGPPSVMDFDPETRARLARQAMGGVVDMSGVNRVNQKFTDISALLKRLRGVLPDMRLAERFR